MKSTLNQERIVPSQQIVYQSFSLKVIVSVFMFLFIFVAQGEPVGIRPYELDWANRTNDHWPAIVDFEGSQKWTVETENAAASFVHSRTQQIFGKYVGKLTYRSKGKGKPVVVVRPALPIAVKPNDFDMIALWIYGNNWAYEPDPSTPQVEVEVLFKNPALKGEIAVPIGPVRWKEWFIAMKRPTKEQLKHLGKPGTTFTGFRITNGTNTADRVLYFDSLTLHKEDPQPLVFKPRSRRGIDMFPGQGSGANTGSGRLPFPTREETILPDSAAPGSVNSVEKAGDSYNFYYKGKDGCLTVNYKPVSGTWSDIKVRWNDGPWFHPLYGGGARFAGGQEGLLPSSVNLQSLQLKDNKLTAVWRYILNEMNVDVTYTFQMKGKSLIVDTFSLGGKIGTVVYGGAKGLTNPKTFVIPYYSYGYDSKRPAVVMSEQDGKPLFFSANTDWYRSNSSKPWAKNTVETGIAYANGGVTYLPKTDGTVNDCFERFFITVSPEFEETLPNIPNPKSPYKHISGTHQWRSWGTHNYNYNKEFWSLIWRLGMRKCLVTDHEISWRDGAESFTFRTKAAPKKGGDQAMYNNARFMQDQLGFIFGLYNNFADLGSTNAHWHKDFILRDADNQLMRSWPRCYRPKPQYAVEYCEKLSPLIQKKYKYSASYCDVHTATTPWLSCDFDSRVPGAGTFAATFYAYGEVMLLQKKSFGGPVFSEGPHYCFYSGLTDGNYAQEATYCIQTDPWLVDFNLRKIHDQECNIGVGSTWMFFWFRDILNSKDGLDAGVDRFLAATLAFGHTGWLVDIGGLRRTMRGYFMLQQLHSRYTQSSVDTIGYVDAKGKIHSTSAALFNGAYKNSHLVIRYKDGTCLAVNGSSNLRMKTVFNGRNIDLPPQGYLGWTEDGKVDVISDDINGERGDYAVTPEYIYIDGRDKKFQRFPLLASSGAGVLRKIEDNVWELIPMDGVECGVGKINDMEVISAVALDRQMKEIGNVELRRSRGMTYVVPVRNAFSYRLTFGKKEIPIGLSCNKAVVSGGERVIVKNSTGHTYNIEIPKNVRNLQRFWYELNGEWIDFTVEDFVTVSHEVVADSIVFKFNTNRDGISKLECRFNGIIKTFHLNKNGMGQVSFPIPKTEENNLCKLPLIITAGELSQTYNFWFEGSTKKHVIEIGKQNVDAGFCVRNSKEQSLDTKSGANAAWGAFSSGSKVKHGWFLHPPYTGNKVGYTFIKIPFILPKSNHITFEANIGKRDGTFLGDGILCKVEILDAKGKITTIARKHLSGYGWKTIKADLSKWSGQKIWIKLISDVGPANSPVGDHSCWTDIQIKCGQTYMIQTPQIDFNAFEIQIPKDYVPNLTVELLRKAKKGWLCYKAVNFSRNNIGFLNNIKLGKMTGSENVWSRLMGWNDEVRKELSKEALASLGMYNKFQLNKPAIGNFRLRDIRIILLLDDGRMVSSKVTATPISTPADWWLGEGIFVERSMPIMIPIEF